MIRAIIIDDESKAREAINDLILLGGSNVNIIAEAENVENGINAIKEHKPDLVFLDIQMPDGTGFDLLKHFSNPDFKVIFITAFEEYALQGFKFCAIDYLLKPINPREFIKAIDKVKELSEKDNLKLQLEAFFSNIDDKNNQKKKLVLKTSESIHLVNVHDIIRCESDKCYTEFHLNNNKKIVVSKVLKEFDDLLNEYGFIRPHQSHLINLNYIESFEKSEGGFIRMCDNASIPVSSRKKESVLRIFENL